MTHTGLKTNLSLLSTNEVPYFSPCLYQMIRGAIFHFCTDSISQYMNEMVSKTLTPIQA